MKALEMFKLRKQEKTLCTLSQTKGTSKFHLIGWKAICCVMCTFLKHVIHHSAVTTLKTTHWTGAPDQHLMAANTFQCLSSRGQWGSTYCSQRVQAVTVDPQQWRCWAHHVTVPIPPAGFFYEAHFVLLATESSLCFHTASFHPFHSQPAEYTWSRPAASLLSCLSLRRLFTSDLIWTWSSRYRLYGQRTAGTHKRWLDEEVKM